MIQQFLSCPDCCIDVCKVCGCFLVFSIVCVRKLDGGFEQPAKEEKELC